MTKQDVAFEISKQTGMTPEDAKKSVEAFMDVVKTSMAKGNHIFLRGFGTFLRKRQAPKVARNISLGTAVQIPERIVPAFKPSKEFKTLFE